MKRADLLHGFKNETDKQKVKTTLLKLFKHLDLNQIVLCGGLAIRYHFATNGIKYPEKEFNDLDMLAETVSAIKPTVGKDFLIYHYHNYVGPKKVGHPDDFFVAILDEETKIKTDIFSFTPYTPIEPMEVEFEGYKVKMRTAEDQLATQVLETSDVFNGEKIDPKWIRNIEGLLKCANPEQAEKCFRMKKINRFKEPLTEIYAKITEYLKLHPEQLVDKPCRRKPYVCELCEHTGTFKVEPMEKIYKILGYTE